MIPPCLWLNNHSIHNLYLSNWKVKKVSLLNDSHKIIGNFFLFFLWRFDLSVSYKEIFLIQYLRVKKWYGFNLFFFVYHSAGEMSGRVKELVMIGASHKRQRPLLFAVMEQDFIIYECFPFGTRNVNTHLSVRFRRVSRTILYIFYFYFSSLIIPCLFSGFINMSSQFYLFHISRKLFRISRSLYMMLVNEYLATRMSLIRTSFCLFSERIEPFDSQLLFLLFACYVS